MYLINNATAMRSISLCTTTRTVHTAFSSHDTRAGSAACLVLQHQPGCLPACPPARLAPRCCRARWLYYHTSRFIWSHHFWVTSSDTLGLAEGALSHSQSVARKGAGEESQRGRGGGEEGGGVGGKALPGSSVEQGTTG